MLIETKYLGSLEIPEEKIIFFPQGLFAFEDKHHYVLIEQEHPLWHLQSTEESQLAFLVLNPFLFKANYEFKLSKKDQAELEIKKPEELAVFCITAIPGDIKKATVNLLAPLVINISLKKGKQIVLYQQNYTTKHYLWPEMQTIRGGEQHAGSHTQKK